MEEKEILRTDRCLELPGRDARFTPEVFHIWQGSGCGLQQLHANLAEQNPPKTEGLQPARFSSLQMSTFFGTGQRAHHQSSDVRLSLMDHPEAVRPTGPCAATFDLEPLRSPQPPMEKSGKARSWLRPAPRSRGTTALQRRARTVQHPPAGWRSTTRATTRSGSPAQGCAQTGLNAIQSSCGARNARTKGGRESPTRGGPEPQAHHLHTTPEHRGSTTCAAAVKG